MNEINTNLNDPLYNSELTEEDIFNYLQNLHVGKVVIEYLSSRLKQMHISVLGRYNGTLFELMDSGKLEGWCWQTTESAIVFLNDDDYIERGNLYFDKNNAYYHAWICFSYNDMEYVFDPCLKIICERDDYVRVFRAEILGCVTAIDVKNELIRQITSKANCSDSEERRIANNFVKRMLGDKYEKYLAEKAGEVTVHGLEDVNTPLYRNGAGYTADIVDNKIKKMKVHYYYIDC